MISFLFKITHSDLVDLLASWLVSKSVALLDTSLCSHGERPIFLSLPSFASFVLNSPSITDVSYMEWSVLRGHNLETLNLSRNLSNVNVKFSCLKRLSIDNSNIDFDVILKWSTSSSVLTALDISSIRVESAKQVQILYACREKLKCLKLRGNTIVCLFVANVIVSLETLELVRETDNFGDLDSGMGTFLMLCKFKDSLVSLDIDFSFESTISILDSFPNLTEILLGSGGVHIQGVAIARTNLKIIDIHSMALNRSDPESVSCVVNAQYTYYPQPDFVSLIDQNIANLTVNTYLSGSLNFDMAKLSTVQSLVIMSCLFSGPKQDASHTGQILIAFAKNNKQLRSAHISCIWDVKYNELFEFLHSCPKLELFQFKSWSTDAEKFAYIITSEAAFPCLKRFFVTGLIENATNIAYSLERLKNRMPYVDIEWGI